MNTQRTRYTGYTKEQGAASMRYVREKLDTITLRFQKGFKAVVTSHLELTGESLVGFFKRAAEETIARDRARMREDFKPAPKIEEEQK